MAGIQAHLLPPHHLMPLTSEQQERLESNFQENRNPSYMELTIIAAEVGLKESDVKVRLKTCLYLS